MRQLILQCILLCICSSCTSDNIQPSSKTDLEKFQGTWIFVSDVIDGRETDIKDLANIKSYSSSCLHSVFACYYVHTVHKKLQKMSILSIISMLWYPICTATAPEKTIPAF